MTERYVSPPQFKTDKEAVEFYLPKTVQVYLGLDRNTKRKDLGQQYITLATALRDDWKANNFTEFDTASLKNYEEWVITHERGGDSHAIQRNISTSKSHDHAKSTTA